MQVETKFLLDECVTSRLGKQIEITNSAFHCSVKLVGKSAPDAEVLKFATQNGYLLVTEDKELIIQCMKNNVPVAWYRDGKAFEIVVSQTFAIPYKASGPPIKTKKAKLKQKRSILSSLTRLFRWV